MFSDPDVVDRPDGRPIWMQDSAFHPDGFVTPFHLDSTTTNGACGPDPGHDWTAQHVYWHDGRIDGFALLGGQTMGYFTEADLPYHNALADEFTLCDGYHCSVIGPTSPNRHYAMSATIDPEGAAGGPATDNRLGPFSWETYPERLQKAGITWRIYQEADDFGDNMLESFSNFQGLAETDPLYDAAVRTRDRDAFAADAAAGNLPQVSWIVAPQATSEHPSAGPPAPGEDLVARSLGALMANPKVWAKTVFILSYDENGGYFDHVPPPIAPPGTPGESVGGVPIGLGFRVPTIVASPWSTGGRVSSMLFDHTSTLRLLETRFGVEIPNISDWRRETCGDLIETLDFSSTVLDVPDLPETAARAVSVPAACSTLPPASPPSPQRYPDGSVATR